jgi:hypothetical protein
MRVRLPLKQNFSAHTESTHITSQNLIKILSNDPIKLIVNIMHQTNFSSQLDVFIKSIISHPFLMHFTPIIVSTKSLPPRPVALWWPKFVGGGGGRKSAGGYRATFSLRPNSTESEKSLVFFQSINIL